MAMTCLVSCSSDDAVVLGIDDVAGKTFHSYGTDKVRVTVNGVEDDEVVSFEKDEENEGILNVSISGMMPFLDGGEMVVPVKVKEGEQLEFYGETGTDRYNMSITGKFYYLDGYKDYKRVEIDCIYKTLYPKNGAEYVFDFTKKPVKVKMYRTFDVDVEGEKIELHDLAQQTFDIITSHISETVQQLKMTFHDNGTVDVALKKTGSSFEPWMSSQYRFNQNGNLAIIVPDDRLAELNKTFLGNEKKTSPFGWTFPTDLGSVYALNFKIWENEDNALSISLYPTIELAALELIMTGNAKEWTTEREFSMIKAMRQQALDNRFDYNYVTEFTSLPVE